MAATSKVIATVTTYPYQVVKSRMQTEQKYLKQEYNQVSKTLASIYRFAFPSHLLDTRESAVSTRDYESISSECYPVHVLHLVHLRYYLPT
jgi:hypothetical protein